MSVIDTVKLNQMTKLVASFLNRADTVAFHEPVDPRAMNIPDYFQVVKNPMDLGTVSTRRWLPLLLHMMVNSTLLHIYQNY